MPVLVGGCAGRAGITVGNDGSAVPYTHASNSPVSGSSANRLTWAVNVVVVTAPPRCSPAQPRSIRKNASSPIAQRTACTVSPPRS